MDGGGEQDLECLYKWIDTYPITRQKRNINRDFSDAVPLAEILKEHYPRLVELHNYTPKNSLQQKLVNWDTLNRKVLSKIDMTLSTNMMGELANSTIGAIEKVLRDLRANLIIKDMAERRLEEVFVVEGLSTDVNGAIPVKLKTGSKLTDQKIVPAEMFAKMESDIIEKNEAIDIMRHKLQHLENLLAIKEERINDLTKQVENISNHCSKASSTSLGGGSRFFNKIF